MNKWNVGPEIINKSDRYYPLAKTQGWTICHHLILSSPRLGCNAFILFSSALIWSAAVFLLFFVYFIMGFSIITVLSLYSLYECWFFHCYFDFLITTGRWSNELCVLKQFKIFSFLTSRIYHPGLSNQRPYCRLGRVQGQLSLNKFTEVVMCFISKMSDYIVPPVTVKVFPNQKLWVDRTVCVALKAHTAAYNEWLI